MESSQRRKEKYPQRSEGSERVEKRDSFRMAVDVAFRLLAMRPRSEKEIRDKIDKKGWGDEAEKVIAYLREHKLIDDKEFAEWWIKQRNEYRPRSKRMLKQEMKLKGINESLVQGALVGTREDESILKIVEKARNRLIKEGEMKAKEKLYRKLSFQGFGWDKIREVVDREVKRWYS